MRTSSFVIMGRPSKMLEKVNVLQNIEALSVKETEDSADSKASFQKLLKYSKTLPEDFNYKKELEKARDERYGNIDCRKHFYKVFKNEKGE
jgi:hypothetical protein